MVFLAVAIHRSFRSIIECAWLSDEFYYRSFERDRGVSGSGEPPGALFRQDTGQPVERIHDALARPSRGREFQPNNGDQLAEFVRSTNAMDEFDACS